MTDEDRIRTAPKIMITLGAIALGAVCYLTTCNDSIEERMRDEATPAGIAEHPTMNLDRRYEPQIYVGPTMSDASRREYLQPACVLQQETDTAEHHPAP